MKTVLDFYGLPINVGDVVSFPAGASLNDGVVEKIKPGKHLHTLKVRNSSNYLKTKYSKDVVNKTLITRQLAEYKI